MAKVYPVVKKGENPFNYKNPSFLVRFTDHYGRIIPRRYSGLTLRQQKQLANEVKKARFMAILPYVR